MTTSPIIRAGLAAANQQGKVVSIEVAAQMVETIKQSGAKVALCHGVFDLLHLGHVRHLRLARQEGDFLVVSITADAFVNKGPGRPVFPAGMRAEMLASLETVDLVVVNQSATAVPVLLALKPSVYVKGAEYANASDDVTGKIVDEQEAVEKGGGYIVFTDDIVFSSSSLMNQHLDIYDPALREYLEQCRSSGLLQRSLAAIEAVADKSVLLVGDTILDEYVYVSPMGKSAKENIIATRMVDREIFAGGVIAAANHLASFCREVEIVTCLGADDSHEEFIRQVLRPNVKLTAIYRSGAPTTKKTRFVDQAYLRKMFEVYDFDDAPLDVGDQQQFDADVAERAARYDMVVVADFGHGLIAESTIETLTRESRFLAVNAQTNSANHGYNLITRYKRADFICIDSPEARLAVADKNSDIEVVIRDRLSQRIDCSRIVVTLGRQGCITYDRDAEGHFHIIPAFTKTVVDTVGAGDAFLAVASPLAATGADMAVLGFIGNAAGALKVGIVGHRHSIEKSQLIKSITALLK